MEIYNRLKPRQSGKTTELIDLAKILCELDRKVVLVIHNQRNLHIFKKKHPEIINEETYKFNLNVCSAESFEMATRGLRYDSILIDDITLISPKYLEIMDMLALVNKANVYSTDSPEWRKDLFKGNQPI